MTKEYIQSNKKTNKRDVREGIRKNNNMTEKSNRRARETLYKYGMKKRTRLNKGKTTM